MHPVTSSFIRKTYIGVHESCLTYHAEFRPVLMILPQLIHMDVTSVAQNYVARCIKMLWPCSSFTSMHVRLVEHNLMHEEHQSVMFNWHNGLVTQYVWAGEQRTQLTLCHVQPEKTMTSCWQVLWSNSRMQKASRGLRRQVRACNWHRHMHLKRACSDILLSSRLQL